MTKAEISEGIAKFTGAVDRHKRKIIDIGNASWAPITQGTETTRVREFLTKKGAGVDYLNKNLASLLSKSGRVVKFAGVFLHGTPMVYGWTFKNGKKVKNGDCELADLQTVFLYLDSCNTIKQMSVSGQEEADRRRPRHWQ